MPRSLTRQRGRGRRLDVTRGRRCIWYQLDRGDRELVVLAGNGSFYVASGDRVSDQ